MYITFMHIIHLYIKYIAYKIMYSYFSMDLLH